MAFKFTPYPDQRLIGERRQDRASGHGLCHRRSPAKVALVVNGNLLKVAAIKMYLLEGPA